MKIFFFILVPIKPKFCDSNGVHTLSSQNMTLDLLFILGESSADNPARGKKMAGFRC